MTPEHTALVADLKHAAENSGMMDAGIWPLLCTQSATALRELAGEIERLNEKLPCGHRKVDMDDSYKGCVLCQFKDGYHEYEAENEALRKVLREMVEAEWMVTHDWGGDRGAVLDRARAALADKQGET